MLGQEAALTMSRAVRILTIGDDETSSSFTFGRVGGLVTGADGRIYVLDGLECEVKVFDRMGKHVSTFGRSGAGPGEFSCASALSLEAGNLRVLDHQQRRLGIFTPDGRHIKTDALAPVGNDVPMTAVSRPVRHDWYLKSVTQIVTLGKQPAYDPFRYIVLQNIRTKRVDTVAKMRLDFVLGSPGKADFGRAITAGFGDGGAWTILGDSLIASVDGYDGTVRWHLISPAGPRLIRTERIGRAGPRVTTADVREMESRIAAMPRWAGARLSFAGWPTHWSVATRALFGADGALWVGGPNRVRKTIVWTKYPVVGAPINVELPQDYWLMWARDDRLFGHTTTSSGSPVVVVYQVR